MKPLNMVFGFTYVYGARQHPLGLHPEQAVFMMRVSLFPTQISSVFICNKTAIVVEFGVPSRCVKLFLRQNNSLVTNNLPT